MPWRHGDRPVSSGARDGVHDGVGVLDELLNIATVGGVALQPFDAIQGGVSW